MLSNILKTAIRNLLRFRVYSAINIAGLAVGTAACLLIFLHVQNDLSFDSFNGNCDRIYRVIQEWNQNGKGVTWSITPAGYAGAFSNEFPDIKTVRLTMAGMFAPVLKWEENTFQSSDFIFADSAFFEMFNFPLIEGNPRTALSAPLSLVIAQSEAKKIFGKADPVGKTLRVMNEFDFKITGVAKDPPQNSSIQFNYVGSFVSLENIRHDPGILSNMSGSNYYTFLWLRPGMNVQSVRGWLPSFDRYLSGKGNAGTKVYLEPLRTIHFDENLMFDFANRGDIGYDYIFAAIAVFILLIACVNFVNISTARSASRAKEIGLRKVLGAKRAQLIRQFVLEFVLLAFIAVVLAIGIVEISLPVFNSVSGEHLSAGVIVSPGLLIPFVGLWTVVVLVSCSYPSFYLSSMAPANAIKSFFGQTGSASLIRKSLIVFQFACAVFLIAGTAVMWSQYNFLKSHKLGFDPHQVVYQWSNIETNKSFGAFRSQLLRKPGILSVARASWVPGHSQDIEGYWWNGKTERQTGSFYTLFVSPDYADVLGLELAAGRNFSRRMPTDWSSAMMLNETAARMMGWSPDSAVGRPVGTYYHPNGKVIGVVKDFNFKSLQHSIEPVVILMDSSLNYYNTVVVKLSSNDLPGSIGYLQSTWKHFSPDFPFNYDFLDRSFGQQYDAEQKLGELFSSFSALSVLIACLGLFGLAAYAAQQRTKEMGIRKVLGASLGQIVGLIVGDFVRLVLISNAIAWPLAYFAMQNWLQNFAYRTPVSPWIFLCSGLLVTIIALLTVSAHGIKAGTANPVESLRYE